MTIRKIHEMKIGKVSDKWDLYLHIYDKIFLENKNNHISILEIGIQNGGSLETYANYFNNGKLFVGCDININCSKLSYSDNRIKVIIGDANTDTTQKSILEINDKYDYIIDDGSHHSTDILNSFIRYFPFVKPGGLFVIEDTHTLYDKNYGGGILNDFSAIGFFKKMIDIANFEWWENDITIDNYLSSFFKKRIPSFITQGWIQSLEFHNSMIIIHKAKFPSHKKLGKRIITGNEYTVVDLSKINSTN